MTGHDPGSVAQRLADGTALRRRRWNTLATLWPEFAQIPGDDLRVARYFSDLRDEVVARLELPADRRTALVEPALRVVTGQTFSPVAQVIPAGKHRTIMVFDAGLHIFVNRYVHAASTYFLPQRPRRAATDRTRTRPSRLWAPAGASLATMLDWTASRAGVPFGPAITVSPYQARQAWSFVRMAEVFALCHELAHVVDGVESATTRPAPIDDQPFEVISSGQQEELAADALGFRMMLETLPGSDVVLGMAGSLYLLHAISLVELFALNTNRARPPDPRYPNPSLRIAVFLDLVRQIAGDAYGDGMESLNDQLTQMDRQVLTIAVEKWDRARAELDDLFERATDREMSIRDSFIDSARTLMRLSPTAMSDKLHAELEASHDDERTPAGALLAGRLLFGLRPELQLLLLPPELLAAQYEYFGPAFFDRGA